MRLQRPSTITCDRRAHPLALLRIRSSTYVLESNAVAAALMAIGPGATICAALLLGLTRADSARYSFLLGIPAIAGAAIFEADDAFRSLGSDAIPRSLSARSSPFLVYRVILGVILLGLVAAGVIIKAHAGAGPS